MTRASTNQPFAGQRALITGGTKGIGRAVARLLVAQGAHVTLTYASDTAAAEATAAELGADSAAIVRADMQDEAAIDQLVEVVYASGPLDMLLLNAAYQEKVSFLDTTRELLAKTVGMNVLGNFQLAHAVATRMIEGNVAGRIVVSGSPHAHLIFENAFAYDASKAALHHMVRCMALPLIRHGIRVNAVEIGWTITEGERRFLTEEKQRELSKAGIPIGRSAQPEEIAQPIVFMLSDASSYAAGTILQIDGGFCLQPAAGA